MNFGSHTAKNILHLGFFAVLLHDYFLALNVYTGFVVLMILVVFPHL